MSSSAAEPLLLRNQICHALYSATNALIRAYRPLLEPLDLTYPQYLVMLSLWERDGVPIKHLVEETRLDSGTLTPILKRLEQKGLIARRKDEHDERQWLIQLSADGRKMHTEAQQIPQQLWCLSSLSLADATALKASVDHLYHDLIQQERGSTNA